MKIVVDLKKPEVVNTEENMLLSSQARKQAENKYETFEKYPQENKIEGKDNLNSFFNSDEFIPDSETKNILSHQDVSIFTLLIKLSTKKLIFLMIISIPFSIMAGALVPIWNLQSVYVLNDLSELFQLREKSGPEIEAKREQVFDDLKKTTYLVYILGSVGFVSFFLSNFIWSYCGYQQILFLKTNYFKTILNQEQGWFDQYNAYEFATKVQCQFENIELVLGEKIGTFLEYSGQFFILIIISFTTSWNISLVGFCFFPVYYFINMLIEYFLSKAAAKGRIYWEKAGGIGEEIIYNIKTIVSFSNFDYEKKRFSSLANNVEHYDLKKSFLNSLNSSLFAFFIQLFKSILFFYGRVLLMNEKHNGNTNDKFKPGDIIVVPDCLDDIFLLSIKLFPIFKFFSEARSSASDYFSLLEREPQCDLSNSHQKPDLSLIKGKIEFKDATFYYQKDKTKKKVLDGLNLVVEPGQKVALVGESGCGKSTVINIIERLYDLTGGTLLIDGINIKDFDIKYLHSLIGYVPQEPVLFNKSIEYNVVFGREKEIVERGENVDELLQRACEQASALEFINKNKERFKYNVGAKGSKLSGGQRQRLAIARAILLNPKILILDEATSALDNKAEEEVTKTLDLINQKNKMTTLIIAHKLKTIRNADIIFVLKNGKIFEKGTHEELMNLKGLYYNLAKNEVKTKDLVLAKELSKKNTLIRIATSISVKELLNSKSYNNKKKKEFLKSASYNHTLWVKKLNELYKNQGQAVKFSQLFSFLGRENINLAIGSFFAILYGIIHIIFGLIFAKIQSIFAYTNYTKLGSESLKYSIIFFVLAILFFISKFTTDYQLGYVGCIVTNRARNQMVDKYLQLDMGFYDLEENDPGALLTKLCVETTVLGSLIPLVFGNTVFCITAIILATALAFSNSWMFTLIYLPAAIIRGGSFILANKTRKGNDQESIKSDIEAGGVLSECVINTKPIFAYNFQEESINLFESLLTKYKKKFYINCILRGICVGLANLAHFCGYAFYYYIEGIYIKDPKKKADYAKINQTFRCMGYGVNGFESNIVAILDFSKAIVSFKSIFKVLNYEVIIPPFKNDNLHLKNPSNLHGKIEFKNVRFAYPSNPKREILKGVNFVIPPGKAAALVGFSGCGKSTVLQLLQRFYEPTSGEILIDDVKISNYNLYELRKKIGIVSQEPCLFKRNLISNILYGNLDAKMEDVYNSAKMVKLEKYFQIGTNIEKDPHLSGGEKQRISIARIFLKNPSILLLDEATSALDKENEEHVVKCLKNLQKQITSIAVAHRLNTIKDSDIIIVFENGQIVEQGNHVQLINKNGKYKKLYEYSEN